MSESFETYSECKDRNITHQTQKKKNHVGLVCWKSEECLIEVSSYGTEVNKINFTALARKYGMKNSSGSFPGNGGQVVKEFLIESGVDISQFDYKSKEQSETRTRRHKRKIQGTDIAIPCDPTNKNVKDALKRLVDEGKYTLGELIVPQAFQQVVLNEDLSLSVCEFQTLGRKQQLKRIRENMNRKQQKYFRLFSDIELDEMDDSNIIKELNRIHEYDEFKSDDELRMIFKLHQRRRFLQFWHDGSTIANHGHLLIMVNTVYDIAIYLTNEEYFLKYGHHKDVQSEIEKPELYLFGRCPSNEQQMLYGDTRNEDIKTTKYPTKIGDICIQDIIRFFHGDGPACQLEAGQQKGGDFPCWVCPINMNSSNDVAHVFYQPIMGIKERIRKVLMTKSSKDKTKLNNLHMFSKLKKHEVEIELQERNIKYSCEEKAPELNQKLRNEMHGIQRLPALFFTEPEASPENMLLELYEILPCEPLHDVKGHIQNLFEEIPYRTKKEKLLQNTIDHVMGGKNCNRGVDYRVGLIQLVVLLRDKIDDDIFNIFETMCEIQEVLYSGESKRSVEMILRLQNQSFLHMMLLKKIVKDKPLSPKLTKKKFYGKYLHALIAHAPMLLRMVSGKSINTEEEERTFNSLKTITTSTTNFHPDFIHPDHVILNGIIRYQAKGDFNKGDFSIPHSQ